MSAAKGSRPEPNFARLITEEDLRRNVVSAHALRRFVQHLQPGIPDADQVAVDLAIDRLNGLSPASDIDTAHLRWQDFKTRMDAQPRRPPRAAGQDAL